MDMNKAFYVKKENINTRWHLIDAQGKIIGRLATEVANLLYGKNKVTYAPHTGDGDFVVIVNAEKAIFTGKKMEQKIYQYVSGWMGGKKELTATQVAKRDQTRLLEHAIKGMLPKNTLGHEALKRVRIYVGNNHPHMAQF